MFGWRKRQIAHKVDKDINDAAAQPVAYQTPEPELAKNKDALYTIGLNQAGYTQLVIKMNYGTATLTMSPDLVRKLIRQLEATLDEKEELQ
jgi:hypothetical protein